MNWLNRILVVIPLFIYGVLAFAAELPSASPESVGLSSQRLQRIANVLHAKVDGGEIPGYVALVARHGKVAYYEAYGAQDPNQKIAMSRDSIFRIYSMTKPITSVAAMILVEEGRIKLSDPVSMYLPDLAKLQVATNGAQVKDVAALETKPAAQPIRVFDLLMHTSGLTYGFFKAYEWDCGGNDALHRRVYPWNERTRMDRRQDCAVHHALRRR